VLVLEDNAAHLSMTADIAANAGHLNQPLFGINDQTSGAE
jgi:hypothetical protein